MKTLKAYVVSAVVLVALCVIAPWSIRHASAQGSYRILVTNDDGVRAPGILAVAQALRAVGEVVIVAPADDQSGKGHSLTLAGPIYADTVQLAEGMTATALTATPATCVKMAISRLMSQKPDLVVSGINPGYNGGMLAYVSGTVGAAREAALQGIPAIAASVDARGNVEYTVAAEFTVRVANFIKTRHIDPGVFFNVNVPAGSRESIKGVRLTTQSTVSYAEHYEEQKTPRGRRYFWNIVESPGNSSKESDLGAVADGYVSITPLRVGEFDGKTVTAWKTKLERDLSTNRPASPTLPRK